MQKPEGVGPANWRAQKETRVAFMEHVTCLPLFLGLRLGKEERGPVKIEE